MIPARLLAALLVGLMLASCVQRVHIEGEPLQVELRRDYVRAATRTQPHSSIRPVSTSHCKVGWPDGTIHSGEEFVVVVAVVVAVVVVTAVVVAFVDSVADSCGGTDVTVRTLSPRTSQPIFWGHNQINIPPACFDDEGWAELHIYADGTWPSHSLVRIRRGQQRLVLEPSLLRAASAAEKIGDGR
jgi:hypothetical protein